MPHKYFSIDGTATFVHHTGPSTLPDQPPVCDLGQTLLCLHGAGGSLGHFDDVIQKLHTSHRLIAFDQPGHGRSGQLDSLGSIDRMADFTLAFCDKLGLEGLVLFGHDMGAAVALRCAQERPELVRALVLCAAGDRFDLPDALILQARRVSEGKERRPFDVAAFSKRTSPDVMKRGFMLGVRTDPRATFGDLLACRDWVGADALGGIRQPSLVIHGEDDYGWVRERASALTEALQSSRLDVVASAGHQILLEAPEALAASVGDFLGNLS
jgi:pimeloyl-ACP methyl ester carboxylesterase